MVDFMSPEKRSHVMSCIRSKNTKPERTLRSMLHRAGMRFRIHVADLPGNPDIVFTRVRIAIFVDGDFWHGYRLPKWEHKLLKPYWKNKIMRNRERDQKNRTILRSMGWKVVRIWEHRLKKDPEKVLSEIVSLIKERSSPLRT